MGSVAKISRGLFRLHDTCNVYVVRDGDGGLVVDFGSGSVLDQLGDFDIERVKTVLVTHHHRDQVQGLARAVTAGSEIWVPPVERDLIADVDNHWQGRAIANNYNLREDRFSLLQSVPVTGAVTEYRPMRFGSLDVLPLPTPGHTIGSVSYLATVDGRRVAFTGDLIYAPGKVWSLAATMWSLGEMSGVAATVLSLLALREQSPDLLLPSHGEPIENPAEAIDRTVAELRRMLDFRNWGGVLDAWLAEPYLQLTPHLLHNQTSHSYGYALISETGKALLIDYGYDFCPGLAAGTDRASRRPWLYNIDRLKRDHGVTSIDAVIPTHYHDDHVAGFNLLREVEGTQVWAPANFADVLERPTRYDVPCLWYDPIPVDRSLPVDRTVRWQEYELGIYELTGHTVFAAAIAFTVDGTRVVATGDQQDKSWGRHPRHERLNHLYPARVAPDDFIKSAELYARLDPQLMISGHWRPRKVAPDYLEVLDTMGHQFAELHRALLPLEEIDLGLEGYAARIEPYRSDVGGGGTVDLDVWVRNPFEQCRDTRVELVLPAEWEAEPAVHWLPLEGRRACTVRFRVHVGRQPQRRARVAADVRVGDRYLGQHAEALVTVHA
ncbi:MAG: MBL fold metallo-hydrolase [Chloroflexota bacterium]|nr:MBL fold metallo-hydrolase [Chloroflexota bacterium]